MKKVIGFIAIIILVAFVIGINAYYRNKDSNIHYQRQKIFFYSLVCPHCAKVETFMKKNNIRAKIKFNSQEVSQNHDNLMNLVTINGICHQPQNQVVVPLYWTGKKCIVGDKPIISYFKQQMAKKHAKTTR